SRDPLSKPASPRGTNPWAFCFGVRRLVALFALLCLVRQSGDKSPHSKPVVHLGPFPARALAVPSTFLPPTSCRWSMIQVHQLSKRFPLPGGGHVVAVRRVSFAVAPGEVYGLLGPNGAGKTTTLRMLLGLLTPTSGQASVDGFASDKEPDEVKRRVSLVSSSAGLYPGLTVREMLLFFADLYAVPLVEAREELERLAALLGFSDLLARRCATLSTGQKQ